MDGFPSDGVHDNDHLGTLDAVGGAGFRSEAVAMEPCGSAHHWGRQLVALGHEVKLIAYTST
jgi:transposase